MNKILFVSQYFYPEEFRGNDIAFDWVNRGDQVTVITAVPNYPFGKFFKGYGILKKNKEYIRGVEVIRVPVIPRGNGKGLMLMLNYLSFAFFSCIYAFKLSLTRKFDSVFVQQLSPVTMALPGIVVKKMQRIPLILWVLDLWPESLTSAGNIKNKAVLWFFEKIVRIIYSNSDKILISSMGFESSIISKGDYTEKVKYFPNWAEDVFSETNFSIDIPELPNGFIIMFAGNVGEAQDFDNVLSAALLLKSKKQIKFVILGDGRKRAWIEKFCIENDLNETVYCLGRFPISSMPVFFQKADLMLVSLKDEPVFNLTLPAKIQAYMISGKPIIGMMNGEGANVINQSECGLCARASDSNELKDKILELSKLSKVELIELGQNGKVFAKKHFNKQVLLDDLYSQINLKY